VYKICIIGVYFGQLPEYFPLWMKSCKYNSTIDFLIVTDQEIKNNSPNIKVINTTFKEFKELVQSKFDFSISLDRPYKICDYKVAFGIIFDEYLKDYDFWGHCDFDMIFGDIRKFLPDSILSLYDKVLPLGHLSLYKNTIKNNNGFKLSGSHVGDYKAVFSSNKIFGFDETAGVLQIYRKNSLPVYEERIFADISEIYKRFRLALRDKNYKYQVFSFNKGKIIREFYENKVYKFDEFIYMHIKKPKNLKINFSNLDSTECFYITNKGFYPKESDTTINIIKMYNRHPGKIYEHFEKITYNIKRIIKSKLFNAK